MDKSKVAKPKLAYLIPTFRAIQANDTKNWTLADIFDVLFIPKELDFNIVSFNVFGRLEDVKNGENAIEIKIVHQDGSELARQVMTGNLERGFVKFAAQFNFVKLEKEGRYHFEVTQNGKELPDGDKFYLTVVKLK